MVQRETFAMVTSLADDGSPSWRFQAVPTTYPNEKPRPPPTPVRLPLREWVPSHVGEDGIPVLTF